MKIEMGLGTFVAILTLTYIAGQCVGCIKTALLNLAYDDLHKT